MKYTLFLIKTNMTILLLLLLSCNSSQTLENNTTIRSIFSEEETKDLQQIHDFFTNQICEMTDLEDSNTIQCYEKFMEDMKISSYMGTYLYSIPREEIDTLWIKFNCCW